MSEDVAQPVVSETPKPPVNAWAKPLTLPNGQTPSAWQAATAPTPAEAAHQASAQALGLTSSAHLGTRYHFAQPVPSEPAADLTPEVWDEPVGHRGQPYQGRQSQAQPGPNQSGWRRSPHANEPGDLAQNGSLADGVGVAERARGRGRGRGRGRHRYILLTTRLSASVMLLASPG